jgi:tRNA pseudouridine38-40 synthase
VKNVNIEILNNISQLIIGEHDFLSFSKFSNKENNRCVILKSEWILDRSNKKLLYIVRGNRFLHHMVRYLVGTMIATAQNKMTKKEFKRLLAEPIKDAKIYKSPAKGLILKEIFYED